MPLDDDEFDVSEGFGQPWCPRCGRELNLQGACGNLYCQRDGTTSGGEAMPKLRVGPDGLVTIPGALLRPTPEWAEAMGYEVEREPEGSASEPAPTLPAANAASAVIIGEADEGRGSGASPERAWPWRHDEVVHSYLCACGELRVFGAGAYSRDDSGTVTFHNREDCGRSLSNEVFGFCKAVVDGHSRLAEEKRERFAEMYETARLCESAPVTAGARDAKPVPKRKLWRGVDGGQSVLVLQVMGEMWSAWQRWGLVREPEQYPELARVQAILERADDEASIYTR